MARNLTSAIQLASEKNRISTCHLLTVYLDAQTLTWCDYHRSVTYDSSEYSSAGSLLSIDGLNEVSDISVNTVTVTLSAVDTANIALVLANRYIDRRITIHRAFFDDNDALIADPVLVFDGKMNRPAIEEDPEQRSATITVEASNQFSDFERKPGRHTSDADQQAYFPGDKGFEYATQLNKKLTWGS